MRMQSQSTKLVDAFLLILLLLHILHLCVSYGQQLSSPNDDDADDLSSTAYDYPFAAIPNATWINNAALLDHTVNTSDGTQVRVILLRNPSGFGARFACGFICNDTCHTFLFSVFALFVDSGSGITYAAMPRIVWTANRASPVHENATLQLTSNGDLRLTDFDGSLVWSSNSSGMGVSSIQLHKSGNLILADASNRTVWQSWDYLTDSWLPGHILKANQSLVSSLSDSNASEGPYLFGIGNSGLGLYASAPGHPQPYWIGVDFNGTYSIFNSTSSTMDLFNSSASVVGSSTLLATPSAAVNFSVQFLRLDPDGILRLYGADDTTWEVLYSAPPSTTSSCLIPSSCSSYGLCSDGQCSCYNGNLSSSSNPFISVDPQKPNSGCTLSTPLTCDATAASDHYFLQLNNVDYFAIALDGGYNPDYVVNSLDECKQLCFQDCTCEAAFFVNGLGSNATSPGSCYTATKVYTMRKSSDQDLQNNIHYQPTALIKIQNASVSGVSPSTIASPGQQQQSSSNNSLIIGIAVGVGVVLCVSLGLLIRCIYRRGKAKEEEESEEDEDPFLKSVPGLPLRYTYQELKEATQNFAMEKKLGAGGFGSVFLGKMDDGSEVAVKRLEGTRQGQKEFRTEVCTIASVHHLNLVRLCGFCSEKGHRLLVYEFMSKGSLERWIFRSRSSRLNGYETGACEETMIKAPPSSSSSSSSSSSRSRGGEDDKFFLDWSTRFGIALGTAQGLAYLHEGCRERIIHFDVKPQNILLNEHFEAKVSDFGLSKFVKRDESQVMTTMRGTPGYLAPEWLHATVTEKADVYSYGIVLLEIVSGRRCLETTGSEASEYRQYLPTLANLKLQQGQETDLVDGRLIGSFDPQQAQRLLHVALWCIQADPSVRPSMSTVVQMLLGTIPIDPPPITPP